jgi:arylsulfatase A-like enzyme
LSEAGVETIVSPGMLSLDNCCYVRGFSHVLPVQRKAEGHAAQFLERLQRPVDGPLFWWSHFLDTHAPYRAGGRRGPLMDRYVRAVTYVDEQIGRMLAALEERGLGDRVVVIVTGDHGEAFGEHNTRFHATTVYEELIHVPLIVALPGARARTVEVPVSIVDLAPTILDVFGLPAPASIMAESLLPLLRGDRDRFDRPLVVETGRAMRAMYFNDGWKLIVDERNGSIELYDLKRDPQELHNAFGQEGTDSDRRLARLQAYFNAHEYRSGDYTRPYRP